jgi:hypothetical protein
LAGTHFGRFFSQTHLVTLPGIQLLETRLFVENLAMREKRKILDTFVKICTIYSAKCREDKENRVGNVVEIPFTALDVADSMCISKLLCVVANVVGTNTQMKLSS